MTAVQQLIYSLDKLKENLDAASAQGIDLNKKADPSAALYDFKEKRAQYLRDTIQNSLLEVKKASAELLKAAAGDTENEQTAYDISVQVRFLEEFYKQPGKAAPIILKMKNIVQSMTFKEKPQVRAPVRGGSGEYRVTGLPDDIRDEVTADTEEIKKCFDSGCYRSCIILCGRVLETALHRKYFEATGNDLLEKSPGIGLGNLVGKLKDANIAFDPGVSQQIHLINQVRIFSVHKKQDAFYPTKDQTQAIILYTIDVVRRLF
ncbi:MAG: DUF4145 domain-containing protein [Nanoarchaeota archaeon]|nr:DUF4145 domain-containing protein [Nanoarchaeota archaeon]